MPEANRNVATVTQVIEDLIEAGTSFELDALDRIYHDSLQIFMIDAQGQLNQSDKAAFKELFKTKKANGDPPLNTWAEIKHVDANDSHAHVLIRRRVKLMEEEQNLTLSIDLIYEDDRWQVTREVIFLGENV